MFFDFGSHQDANWIVELTNLPRNLAFDHNYKHLESYQNEMADFMEFLVENNVPFKFVDITKTRSALIHFSNKKNATKTQQMLLRQIKSGKTFRGHRFKLTDVKMPKQVC